MPGTTGANLGLEWGWSPHESGWGVDGYNPGAARLDALVNGSVLSSLAAPPGSPAEGDRHLVIATGTGAFAGHEDDIAVRYGSGWTFYTPKEGWRIWNIGTKTDLFFDGTNWLGPKYIIGFASISGVLTASQVLLIHKFSKAVTYPANFGDYLGYSSEAGGTADATASTAMKVQKAVLATPNTFVDIGTITIAAAGVLPTFATSSGTLKTFAKGDVLQVIGPASADATFANAYGTLVGSETP